MSEFNLSVTPTGRPLNMVLALHGLESANLAGKSILDLGCGSSNLGAELISEGLESTVIGLDVNIKNLSRGQEKGTKDSTAFVQAQATALPFRDASFDVVLATYSLPFWAKNEMEIASFFSEITRVLNKGGLFSIYPLATSKQNLELQGSERYKQLNEAARMIGADVLEVGAWEPRPVQRNLRVSSAYRLT